MKKLTKTTTKKQDYIILKSSECVLKQSNGDADKPASILQI